MKTALTTNFQIVTPTFDTIVVLNESNVFKIGVRCVLSS